MPEADVDIFMRFVRAAMYAARTSGLDVLVMGRGDVELVGDILADALVAMDVREVDPRLDLLKERRIPTILIGVPPDGFGLSAEIVDACHVSRCCRMLKRTASTSRHSDRRRAAARTMSTACDLR